MKKSKKPDLTKELIISKTFFWRIALMLGGIAMMLVGFYFMRMVIYSALIKSLFDFLPFIIALAFCVMGFMCFAESFSKVTINSEGIKQANLVKRIFIAKNNVAGFSTLSIKDSEEKELIILSKDQTKKIKIYKQGYNEKEYYELIAKLKSEYRKADSSYRNSVIDNRQKLMEKGGLVFGLCVSMLGIYMLLFVAAIPEEDILLSPGVLSEDVIISRDKRNRAKQLYFVVAEFPTIQFRVSDSEKIHSKAYHLKKNDEVLLTMLKSDYLEEVLKPDPPELKNKLINWNVVDLYGLAANDQMLLDIDDVNSKRTNIPFKIFIILAGIGIAIFYRFFAKVNFK